MFFCIYFRIYLASVVDGMSVDQSLGSAHIELCRVCECLRMYHVSKKVIDILYLDI